jgi:peptidoglycan/LPS O-acetylase OafA/YrhL
MHVRFARKYPAVLALVAALCAITIGPVHAQSAEEARTIEHGKDIFKTRRPASSATSGTHLATKATAAMHCRCATQN